MKKERQPQQRECSFFILLYLHRPWLAGNIFHASVMNLKSADEALSALVDASLGEFLVPGSWFLVPGSWFLVLGSWFLVLG